MLELEESRLCYKEIFDNVTDCIFLLDVTDDGRFRFAGFNPAKEKATGMKNDEVSGKYVDEILPAELASSVISKYESCASTGEITTYDEKLQLPSGPRSYNTQLIPIKDEKGCVTRIIGIAHEITDQKQSEKELWQSSQLLQSVMDNIPQAIFWKDCNLTYLGCNRAFAEDAGLASPAEIVGKTDYELPWFPQADLYRADDQLVLDSGSAKLNYEEPQTTPDGDQIWLLTNKIPIRDTFGNVTAVLGTYEDITRRKQTELELKRRDMLLRTIINSSHDLIFVKDIDGRFLVVSQALACQLGGQTSEELVGKTDYDLFPYELAHSYYMDEQKIIQTGEPMIDKVEPSVRPDGTSLWLLTTKMPYYSAEGKIIGIVGVGHDITERKQTEAERERLQSDLQQSYELLLSIVDTTPDWIFVKDMEHRYRLVNQGYANALHINPEEFIGKNDLELGFPEELVKGNHEKGIRGFWADDRLVMDSGQMQVYPDDPATIDGEIRTFHTIKSPLTKTNGQVWGVLAFARDITEIKKSQEQLELFGFALENALDAIQMMDDQSHYSYVNSHTCQLMGYTREELLNMGAFDLIVDMNPDKLAIIRKKLREDREPVVYETKVRAKSGHVLYVEVTLTPFWFRGKYTVIAICRDKTKEKEMLEQLKLLSCAVENTKDAIQLQDDNHRFIYVNKQYCLDLGYSKEELMEMSVFDVDHTASVDEIHDLQKSIKQDMQPMSLKVTHRAKNGELVPYEIFATPFVFDGQFRVLTICRNLSQIEEYQHQLEMVNDALDHIDTAVFINDNEGRIVYANKRACQSLSYSREELQMMYIPDIDPGMTKESVRHLYSEMVADRSVLFNFKTSHRSKNGWVFPVEIKGTVYSYQDKSYGVSLVCDISRKNEIDDMLIRSEQDFLVLVEHSPDIVVRYDLTLRCAYVNQAWEKITGYPQFDMLDKTPVQNLYMPEDATRGMEEILRHVTQTGHGVTQDFILPNAVTGLPVYLIVDIVPELGLDGKVSGVMVVARDISTLKRYENELKTKHNILEETQKLGHIGSWELDLETNKREWSKETYRIFEMDPDKLSPSNDAFMRLVHPEDRDRVEEVYCELGRTINSCEVELRLLFPDGRVKYVNERGTTQFDNNGKPKLYLGSVQDITQWKELENELMLALEKAEANSRMKSSFLALMSHEIRTPLNAILGFSSLLKDTELTIEERDEFIRLVDLGGTRLTSAIDRILELSKLVSGDIPVKAAPYSPEEIIMQQYQELEELCRDTGKKMLSIKVEIANNLVGKNFVSDAPRIKQAIKILADNALKFTASGEIVLGVKLAGSGQVTFYVSDTGIGIPPEKQDVIFDPFVQVEGSLSRKFEGLGIGLSIARKITSALGGDLTLVSEPGKGSVFSLTIPENIQNKAGSESFLFSLGQ